MKLPWSGSCLHRGAVWWHRDWDRCLPSRPTVVQQVFRERVSGTRPLQVHVRVSFYMKSVVGRTSVDAKTWPVTTGENAAVCSDFHL